MLTAFVLVYLLITILIGRWAARRVKSAGDFIVAGRSLPLGISTCVIFATWFGSETMLGATSEFAQHGLIGVMEDPFGASLCLLLVGLFYARKLYRTNLLTFCDYFRERFGRKAEVVSALLMIPSYFGWIAAQIVAMGIVINTVMGVPHGTAMIASGLIVMAYTYMGGMWSVSVTDFIQTIMIIIGIAIIAFIVVQKAGGIQTVIDRAPAGTFRFLPDRDWNSWLHYLAAWFTIGLGSIPQQDVFQRLMSSKSEKVAQYSSYFGALMYLVIGSVPLLIVLCAQQLYPELAAMGTEEILPNMVLRHGNLFIQVLFFGALLSAVMSTTSGAILAPATVLGENIIRPFFKNITDRQFLRVIRLSVVIVSAISMGMAFSGQNIYELVASSSVLSLVSLFVPLTAGLYWKRSNEAGAILAIVLGTLGYIYSEAMSTETPSLFVGLLSSIAGMLIGTFGWKRMQVTSAM
ncbi:sodium:solute symporter family protein [Chitinophaga sp. GCM10012297]|uniref:Sodium:solute symporter family protein n=1 Tax=Chitinophaga chungangae TaxID=2821488 RepID=A0ABS3Y7Q4_9BACT|nr:sodium:solute symporter family protein [Chitinophaga chungangae]MBO9150707.1 sodium:solute symporter family protein [Chitinophaga chungangae]